ncbi:MAG TPA: hypothetical protein VN777_00260 [Terriglobales bacterium]|nr:hypothetical protein [Terriglobales bacterium]
MNEPRDEEIQSLLKQAIAPLTRNLERDLWPRMLQRLDERSATVPWFDWALLALLALWLCFSPQAIPVLLYHL